MGQAGEGERQERELPQAAGRARLIHRLSPRQAPSSGTLACTAAKQMARIIASWPSSGITSAAFMACSPASGCLAAFLEGLGNLGRHIFLVMLGQDFIGYHHALVIELAQGDDAPPSRNRSGRMPR